MYQIVSENCLRMLSFSFFLIMVRSRLGDPIALKLFLTSLAPLPVGRSWRTAAAFQRRRFYRLRPFQMQHRRSVKTPSSTSRFELGEPCNALLAHSTSRAPEWRPMPPAP